MRVTLRKLGAIGVAAFYGLWSGVAAHGYALNEIVPDVRQPAGVSGGSACPVHAHQLASAGSLSFRWSTVLGSNPTTILTQDQTPAGSLNEIEQTIQQSLSVWTNVRGTTLTPTSLAPLTRISSANACGVDGLNSICFDQPDMAFTPGVLAFTRVVTADSIGIQVGSGPASTEVGQILDADIYFNPSDSLTSFATPQALSASPKSYNLESILIHELGHTLGFSHSAVWSAMMFPFAPAPGTFAGQRPTAQQPDAPLTDDDRTGLRVLYHDPNDTLYVGSIQGHIIPANPISLPSAPPGVTGVFGAHVVAIDASSGTVIAGTLGGWSCTAPGPVQFDGNYEIDQLLVGQSYKIYAEPLDGAVAPSDVSNALVSLCRNSTTDPGWPPLQGCVVPPANTTFTARTRPSP
ncbi:MAG TPA: matrixin family metalloprotease [Verrucomicrobiae bacterium]|nr:matrixin family metalloprotease [Verrucomicrobiae bacterium]